MLKLKKDADDEVPAISVLCQSHKFFQGRVFSIYEQRSPGVVNASFGEGKNIPSHKPVRFHASICPRNLHLLRRMVIIKSNGGFAAISWISHLNMTIRHLLLKPFRVRRAVSVMSQASRVQLFYYSVFFMEIGRRQSLQSGGGRHIDAVLDILEAGTDVSEAVDFSYFNVVSIREVASLFCFPFHALH